MKRYSIRAPFWSRAVRKTVEDGSSASSRGHNEQARVSVDMGGAGRRTDSWRPGTNQHTVPPPNVRREPSRNEPSTSTSKVFAPISDITEGDSKRHKGDKMHHCTDHPPSTEPCFTNTLDIGRLWTCMGRSVFQRHRTRSIPFSVVSYNILADSLMQAHTMLYEECPEWCLDWEYRKNNLLKEILHYNADVLCLQEVQADHYADWFEPELQKAGYRGVYKKRTGKKTDGCATFYKHSTFSLVKEHELEYRMRGVPLMDRDNVAILILLHPRLVDGSICNDTVLCVANTHLLFNKNRGDIKLLQLACLFAEIQKLTTEVNKQTSVKHCPVILCGDFNMTPFCSLYWLIAKGYLDYQGLNKKALSGQNSPYMNLKDRDRLRCNIVPRELNLQYDSTWVPDEMRYSVQAAISEMQACSQDAASRTQGRSQDAACTSQGRSSDAVNRSQGRSLDATSRTQRCSSDVANMSQEPTEHTATNNPTDCRTQGERCTSLSKSLSQTGSNNWPSLGASLYPITKAGNSSCQGSYMNVVGRKRDVCDSQPPQAAPLATPQDCLDPLTFPSCTAITHGLKFWSAYRHHFPNGEPEVSTYHDKEPSCTVDYIFTSAGTDRARTCRQCQQRHSVIELRGVLGLLTEQQLRVLGGLPSNKLSSDHLALQASYFLHL